VVCLKSGNTLWEELQVRYARSVKEVDDFMEIWHQAKPAIDEQRRKEVDEHGSTNLKTPKSGRRSASTILKVSSRNITNIPPIDTSEIFVIM